MSRWLLCCGCSSRSVKVWPVLLLVLQVLCGCWISICFVYCCFLAMLTSSPSYRWRRVMRPRLVNFIGLVDEVLIDEQFCESTICHCRDRSRSCELCRAGRGRLKKRTPTHSICRLRSMFVRCYAVV